MDGLRFNGMVLGHDAAGAGARQVEGNGKLCTAVNAEAPPGYPQTSIVVKRLVFALLTLGLEDGAEVARASDCLTVVRGEIKLVSQAAWKKPCGAFWKESKGHRVSIC